MSKELKLSFILLAVFSAIVMAWKTLMSFFNGVGLNFVAILAIIVVLLLLILQNENVKNRIKDMFLVACVFAVLEFIVYIALEMGVSSLNVYMGFLTYQNVITVLGIFFFAYISFRFITEFKGIRIGFIEFLLGNGKRKTVKEKKSKELENGSLEEKPNKTIETEETVVEIEEE